MSTQKKQIKPIYAILLIGFFSALSVALFMYKDKIIPSQNAAHEELYSTFLKAEGTIVGSENTGGRRSRITYTIQFRDQDENLITVSEDHWQTMPLNIGDKVIMYYNPKDPTKATPESRWKEIMRK
jgi:hypothetical protein